MKRVGVLASGSGSNFQALAEALARPGSPAQVAVLVCNVPGARALERARSLGIPAVTLDHRSFPSREAHEEAVLAALEEHRVELVALCGYLRLVGPAFLRRYPHRVLNVHPALLPAFPGLHGARQALAYGAKVAGCTVHFVDEGTDTGPIIAQAAVPVLAGDTEASLQARIQVEEHRLLPAAVADAARGLLRVTGRVVVRGGAP